MIEVGIGVAAVGIGVAAVGIVVAAVGIGVTAVVWGGTQDSVCSLLLAFEECDSNQQRGD